MTGRTSNLLDQAAPEKSAAGAETASRARRLRVASVCTLFPTDAEPHKGIFVARRVSHVAQIADVRAIQPIPWFPLLRPVRATSPASGCLAPAPEQPRMFYLPGALKRLDGKWLARSIEPLLRRWRDEGGLDLVDAHFGYPEGVGAVLAAGRLGIPVFATLRGNEQVYLRQPAIRGQLLDALQRCHGVVAVSRRLCDAVCDAGVDREKVRVIPNAVDRRLFSPSDQGAARAALGLPAESPVIVSVGQLVRGKGHDVLVRAVHRLRFKHPDVVLAIVGGASYERDWPRSLESLIASLDMKGTVRLAGARPPDEVARWLCAGDVFGLCTEREGCCNSVLEALACGRPVVTTAAGDNAVYVVPSENGYIVAHDDVDAVCSALDAALTREWDSGRISGSLPRDGWDGVARRVVEFFSERLHRDSCGSPAPGA